MPRKSLPKTIGPYRVQSELGRGMMGVVYKARDPVGKRLVALKVIQLAFPAGESRREEFEKRFLSEALIVRSLDHPYIVAAYDVGRDEVDGAPFIALEYLEGRSLSTILEKGPPLPWRESLRIVARVAEALHHAHAQGVVHRDIKPANIMILPAGTPKIMDFGLAKLQAGMDLTATGQFMGTPLYMAPEQAAGRKVDGRTDLFSLGAVAYTMLTGRKAFDGDSVPRILNRVAHEMPPRASRVATGLPESLDDVLNRAMAKAPADRYPDGRHLAEDFTDIVEGRAPHHMAGWQPPAEPESTLVMPRSSLSEEQLPELGLSEEIAGTKKRPAKTARKRRRRPLLLQLGVLGLAVAGLVALLYVSPFWRPRLAVKVGPWLRRAPGYERLQAWVPPPPSSRDMLEALPEGLFPWLNDVLTPWPPEAAPTTRAADDDAVGTPPE